MSEPTPEEVQKVYEEGMALAAERQIRCKKAVMMLGKGIGFGNMMHLAQECWREVLEESPTGVPGGEFRAGPCVALTVQCDHSKLEEGDHCMWCCGCGWLTQRVAKAKEEAGE